MGAKQNLHEGERQLMRRILKVVLTTMALAVALTLIGIFLFRLERIFLILEEFYLNFSWEALAWIVITWFMSGIWFCRTLAVARISNKKDKAKSKIAKAEAEKTRTKAEAEKAKAKAEEAEAKAEKAKKAKK